MKGKKVLTSALALTAVAGSVTPAFAYTDSTGAVNETQVITENQSADCEVYAELGSDFKVTIPKKITLNGATKKGAYTVTCTGDIAGTEYVKVVPDETVVLSSVNLNNVTASITQDKTEWIYNEILENGVIGKGSIDASGITAGAWNGTFNFNVSLESNENEESGEVEATMLDVSIVNYALDEDIASYSIEEGSTWLDVKDNIGIYINDNNEVEVNGKEIFDPTTYTTVKSTDLVKEQTYGCTYRIDIQGLWIGDEWCEDYYVNVCATNTDWNTICSQDSRFKLVNTDEDDSYYWITDYYVLDSPYIVVYSDGTINNVVLAILNGHTNTIVNPENSVAHNGNYLTTYIYQATTAPRYDEEQ